VSTGVPFDQFYKDEFIRLLADGFPPRMAYKKLSMPFTWRTVKAHIDSDATFRDAVKDAITDATAEVEYAVYKEARAGNLSAARFWLANRGDFVDERSAGGGPGTQAIGEVSVKMTVDSLRELLTDGATRGAVIEASSRIAPGDPRELEADDDAGASRADSDLGGGA